MIETVTMCKGTGCGWADCAFHHELLRHKATDPGRPLYIDSAECVALGHNLYLKGERVFSRRTHSPEHRAKLGEASKKPVIARHISGETERFDSIMDASGYCGVSRGTIWCILQGTTKCSRNGWTFDYDKTASCRKKEGGEE